MKSKSKGLRISGKKICEIISYSRILRRKTDNKSPSANEIWDYSPTGELFKVYMWFEMAMEVLRYEKDKKYEKIWKSYFKVK